MGIILDLLEYIHVNKDPNTMAKKGKKHIRERVKKIPQRNWPPPYFLQNCRYHCGAQSDIVSEQWCGRPIYRLSIMVSADVSWPIQKLIGISWIRLIDTINRICGIS
jgi:hypothetical protein